MKFFSKYTNLRVLTPVGMIKFDKGVYDATASEAKELKKVQGFGVTLWCDEPKKVEKDDTKGTNPSK